jgi:broad specificity phosphatase PhoE
MAALTLLFLLLLPRLNASFAETPLAPRNGTDPYHGKALAPSNYTVVRGLFRQTEPDFDPEGYDMLADSFGLLDKGAHRWRRFTEHITHLNKHADKSTTYKVIYIARHGEGYHNVAEAHYGTPAWNCYWSLLNGDGNLTWGPDPVLTPLGEEQARRANAGWKAQRADGVPLPQVLYSSPFSRAAATLEITWRDILLDRGFLPVVMEQWRENIGLHTCDQRRSKREIGEAFRESASRGRLTPAGFTFEPSFTEHDPYWDATYIETEPQRAVRMRMALNEIFARDARTFISVTAHSGVINAFFNAIGQKPFQVQTGGFVPVVIKAVSHPTATMSAITRGQSGTAPTCTADPAPASLMTGRATVSVQPTWYPPCGEGCTPTAVTGTWATPTRTG